MAQPGGREGGVEFGKREEGAVTVVGAENGEADELRVAHQIAEGLSGAQER